MEPVDSGPLCANQVHERTGGQRPEPTQVCSCGAGLIHMLDCPVAMGLPCAFFRALEGEPDAVDARAADEIHSRLMQDYLARAYFHRIRALAPAGNPWQRRREELYAFYATVELEGLDLTDDEEGYERERERLLGLRKEREEARRQRDEMTREEKARERARLGIKTVVERAQEAVALQGAPAPEEGGAGGQEEAPEGPESPPPAEEAAQEPEPQGPELQGPERRGRRRRRRRRRRSGGGPPGPPASGPVDA